MPRFEIGDIVVFKYSKMHKHAPTIDEESSSLHEHTAVCAIMGFSAHTIGIYRVKILLTPDGDGERNVGDEIWADAYRLEPSDVGSNNEDVERKV